VLDEQSRLERRVDLVIWRDERLEQRDRGAQIGILVLHDDVLDAHRIDDAPHLAQDHVVEVLLRGAGIDDDGLAAVHDQVRDVRPQVRFILHTQVEDSGGHFDRRPVVVALLSCRRHRGRS
jgi:hypothetical protein